MSKPDKVSLKQLARDRAMLYTWEQMYRHRMRYQPRDYATFFDLSDSEVKEIEDHYKAVDFPARLVVVNLPKDVDLEWAKARAVKCSSKCYMSETVVTFELGESETHPHYNFLFLSTVEWLAKSRIIREFSSSFKVDQSFVNVTHLTKDDYQKTHSYITKEDIWTLDKRTKKLSPKGRYGVKTPHTKNSE